MVSRGAPVPAWGLSDVAQIAVGAGFTCARLSDGQVKCWGRNDYGQLGAGPPVALAVYGYYSNVPLEVKGLGSGVAAITAGYPNSCALTVAGAVKCWGNNERGRLGNATDTICRGRIAERLRCAPGRRAAEKSSVRAVS